MEVRWRRVTLRLGAKRVDDEPSLGYLGAYDDFRIYRAALPQDAFKLLSR